VRILVTGGAGFVGSNLAVMLAGKPGYAVTVFDNLRRRGSELALPRLRAAGVQFVHGDIRNTEDLEGIAAFDLALECSAEPSVHAGYRGDIRYAVNTNLLGTLNYLEWARRHAGATIFLSTSRVYSIAALKELPLQVKDERFVLAAGESGPGWSERGITEHFSTRGPRSLYGATKLASELLIEEYHAGFGLKTIVNRCGVITGPWQMGKVDQGFFVLWAARHLYGGGLAYTGFGGNGFQVRDVLHVADLFDLICRQIESLDSHNGQVFNVGGGPSCSTSLAELTGLCADHTGVRLTMKSEPATQPVDIPFYITDNNSVTKATGWSPRHSIAEILDDVIGWLERHRKELEPVLA
jgi:CDP-paratose 2-epimerase